jgi:hypothetical protein
MSEALEHRVQILEGKFESLLRSLNLSWISMPEHKPRELAEEALRMTGGDRDKAVEVLIGRCQQFSDIASAVKGFLTLSYPERRDLLEPVERLIDSVIETSNATANR